MVDLEERTLPAGAVDEINRAWCAYKRGYISETDLILLWLDATAQAEGSELHPGWTISPGELFRYVRAGACDCGDEQELERRGLGWLTGALEGARRRQLIGVDGQEITVVSAANGALRGALRGARARSGTGPLRRRFRPAA